MLGTRTKQVFSYGRRNQRVVNATEERDKIDLFSSLNASTVPRAPVVSRMRKREDLVPVKSSPPLPRVVKIRKQKKRPSLVPPPPLNTTAAAERQSCVQNTTKDDKISYPKSARPSLKHDSPIDLTTPPRLPLAAYSINTPGSPAIISGGKVRKKPKARGGTPLSLKRSFAPFVDVEILVLDDDGRRVSQERRTSRTRVIANPINAEPRKRRTEVPGGGPKQQHWIISDRDEGEPLVEHSPVKRVVRKAKTRIIISDDSESDGDAGDAAVRSAAQTPHPETSHITQSIVPVKLDSPPPRPRIPSQFHHKPPLRPTSEWELSDKSILSSPKNPHFQPLRHQFNSSRIAPVIAPPPLRYQHFPSPVSRPRQLTPIRNGAGLRSRFPFQRPVLPSPSTPSDLDDLSFECSVINLNSDLTTSGSSNLDRTSVNAGIHAEPQPEYLVPLLTECAQESCGPHEFSAFIEMFPMDPIVWDTWEEWEAEGAGFRKIGEASYSEVFGIGDVVLKIVPLRDETPKRIGLVKGPTPFQARNKSKSNPASYGTVSQEQEEERDGPPPSDAKDVLKEVIVTRAMGDMCDGFVKLLKTYVVRGRYPEILLKLWDEYFERKGSENVRPDTFGVSQVYAIIVLPNGGPDLEAYTFTNGNKNGWRQACSLFWQVTRALSRAEQLVSFEHRDLHWGQILVRNIPTRNHVSHKVGQTAPSKKELNAIALDQPAYGVQATIIDLGLSRMDAGDGSGGERVHWTPFAEEIFMGEGDYQFDVYRIMKEHTQGVWEDFKPFTNVMWLHYLAIKLIHSKHLKPPAVPRKPTHASVATHTQFSEKDCYDSVIEIEKVLRRCMKAARPKTQTAELGNGRRRTRVPATENTKVGPQSASEVIEYAVKRGWVW